MLLVVMDYPLGQKFFNSRFGSQSLPNANSGNLLPIFYGAESYFTDLDVSLVVNNQPGATAPPAPMGTTVRFWDTFGPFNVAPQVSERRERRGRAVGKPEPVLGVESYSDEFLDAGSVNADGSFRLPVTGRYNIWRILSRGAVSSSVLSDYLPQVLTAPADTFKGEDATIGRTILHSTRYVVWAAPFSGDQFVGPGTITDVQTQNDLENFVTNGGRLFLSGQDIGFALAGQGQANHFFNSVLKARYITDDAGLFFGLNAATSTIAGNYVNQLRQDPWNPAGAARVAFGKFVLNDALRLPTAQCLRRTRGCRYHSTTTTRQLTNAIGDGAFTATSNRWRSERRYPGKPGYDTGGPSGNNPAGRYR